MLAHAEANRGVLRVTYCSISLRSAEGAGRSRNFPNE